MINRPLEEYTDTVTENKSEEEEREDYLATAKDL